MNEANGTNSQQADESRSVVIKTDSVVIQAGQIVLQLSEENIRQLKELLQSQ